MAPTLTRWRDLQILADAACRHFGLRHRRIEAMTHPLSRCWGECEQDGTIRIRVHRLGSKHPLSWRRVTRTLAHELAHLDRNGWHHGPGHTALEQRIAGWWAMHPRWRLLL